MACGDPQKHHYEVWVPSRERFHHNVTLGAWHIRERGVSQWDDASLSRHSPRLPTFAEISCIRSEMAEKETFSDECELPMKKMKTYSSGKRAWVSQVQHTNHCARIKKKNDCSRERFQTCVSIVTLLGGKTISEEEMDKEKAEDIREEETCAKETDVGITEYISAMPGFHGVIKQRYCRVWRSLVQQLFLALHQDISPEILWWLVRPVSCCQVLRLPGE